MPVTIGVFIGPGTNDGHSSAAATPGARPSTTRPTISTASSCSRNFSLGDPVQLGHRHGCGWLGHRRSQLGRQRLVQRGLVLPRQDPQGAGRERHLPSRAACSPARCSSSPSSRCASITCPAAATRSFGSNNEAAENLMTMGYHYRYRPAKTSTPHPAPPPRISRCAALAVARLHGGALVSRLPYSCAVGRNRMLP